MSSTIATDGSRLDLLFGIRYNVGPCQKGTPHDKNLTPAAARFRPLVAAGAPVDQVYSIAGNGVERLRPAGSTRKDPTP